MTSIATANALITERSGRCTRLPKINLFMDRTKRFPASSSFHSSVPSSGDEQSRGHRAAARHQLCIWGSAGRTRLTARWPADVVVLPMKSAPRTGAMRVTTMIASIMPKLP